MRRKYEHVNTKIRAGACRLLSNMVPADIDVAPSPQAASRGRGVGAAGSTALTKT